AYSRAAGYAVQSGVLDRAARRDAPRERTTPMSATAALREKEALDRKANRQRAKAGRSVVFKILRCDGPGKPSRWESFKVPVETGSNVISCLKWIAANPVTTDGRKTTPPVWDSGCLEEVCGACTMVINGKVRQSCSCLIDEYAPLEGDTLTLDDLAYTYRHCGAPEDLIFTEALYQGEPGDPAEIARAMQEVADYREANQPTKARTGGSTFKNPPGHSSWKLIDAAGMRGYRVGGAHVSEMHCNFLINDGEASAEDIETLGETVRARVKAQSGIGLEWEIKRLGVPAEGRPMVAAA
ncbi:MAG: hypothetical protein HC850_16730, partial [Rhodomicrobium sp.]|nr:hypothetical protein [Rhodomicrobium sp.]